MNSVSSSTFSAITSFVESTRDDDAAIVAAEEAATEFGLFIPDVLTGEFLRFLASRAVGSAQLAGHTPTGIVMSPACGVIGLHLFRGFQQAGSDLAHLTCIDPEVEHQQIAKSSFKAGGVKPNGFRFLPSQPLDVIGRLASDSYDIAVAECPVEDIKAIVNSTMQALRPGGVIVLLDTLLDGTIGDTDRTDRQTTTAREADEFIRTLDGATAARLPLGAGATVITKH